jgi:D-alanyl-D-alanine-carboxypeptidase/D-alanyl-D-alanine-endopeptidase
MLFVETLSALFCRAVCGELSTAQAAQPLTAPVLASDIADRYAIIYYGSGAVGMAMVVIDGNQRVFRSFGETRPGNNVHPQLDSVIRIASLTKLMTSEMLVKLLDQGVVKLDDPLSKYAPPGAFDLPGAANPAGEPCHPYQRPAA